MVSTKRSSDRQRVEKCWIPKHSNCEKTMGYSLTDAMISKMDERRKWKNVRTKDGDNMYKKLNNELRRETDAAREDWWKSECNELEELDRRGRSDLMYKKVKILKGWTKPVRNGGIKDAQGELMSEPEEIKKRWKRYIEVLYNKDGKPSEVDFQLEEEIS